VLSRQGLPAGRSPILFENTRIGTLPVRPGPAGRLARRRGGAAGRHAEDGRRQTGKPERVPLCPSMGGFGK